MHKLILILSLLIISTISYADCLCSMVTDENGISVHLSPDIKSHLIYNLPKGTTFSDDGFIGVNCLTKDGEIIPNSGWNKIRLYKYFDSLNTNIGYIFITPNNIMPFWGCTICREIIHEDDLYCKSDDKGLNKRFLDSLRSILELEIYIPELPSNIKEDDFVKDHKDYRKDNDTIFLKLSNYTYSKIISYPKGDYEGDDEHAKTYNYIGFSKGLNKYLIHGQYWESSNYFFVDKKSGDIDTNYLSGYPIISPNSNYFVTFDDDAFGWFDATRISIYEIQDGKLKLLIDWNFNGWRYDNEIIWISEDEFLVAARSLWDEQQWDGYHNKDVKYENDVRKQYIRFKIL